MKYVILYLVFSLVYHTITAQAYINFPQINSIWTTFGGGHNKFTLKEAMYGDTVINNLSYKKIYMSGDYNFNISNSIYRCAIREENKIVYANYGGIEAILYDFNLNIGDTIRLNEYGNASFSLQPFKVEDIDSISIYGKYHKRWKFKQYQAHLEEYWLEGIGSTFGLLNRNKNAWDICFQLVCVSIDSTIVYQPVISEKFMPCYPYSFSYVCEGRENTTFIKDENTGYYSSYLFPNPITNSATFKFGIELDEASIIIYNVFGQEMKREEIFNEENKIINCEKLNEGCYIYNIINKNGAVISKGKFILNR